MHIVGALLIGSGMLLLVYYLPRLFDAWVDRHMNRPAKAPSTLWLLGAVAAIAAGIILIAHH